MVLWALAGAGCAQFGNVATRNDQSAGVNVETGASASVLQGRRAELVMRALSLLGVSYRFGGNSPETGLDCSAFVQLVFRETIGVELPRNTEQISRSCG